MILGLRLYLLWIQIVLAAILRDNQEYQIDFISNVTFMQPVEAAQGYVLGRILNLLLVWK